MKTIMLTKGKETVVDDDTYEWASKYNWTYCGREGKGYAVRVGKIEDIGRVGKMIYLHIEILAYNGIILEDEEEADHEDQDRLNNLFFNLRVGTHRQNNCNKGVRPDSISGLKGVKKVNNRYRASIRGHDKRIHLGYYDSPEDAAKVYDAAAVYLHGEFACINFPENKEEYLKQRKELEIEKETNNER